MLRDVEPALAGTIRRDGQTIRYERFGEGERTIMLFPTWSIVHTDFWRGQVPHLGDRYSVLTFDGVGNGGSDRPVVPARYADDAFVSDAIAVMDAAGVRTAASIAVSRAAAWQLLLGATHPDRLEACVFIGASAPLAPVSAERVEAQRLFDEKLGDHPGWLKWNRHYWQANWPEFLQFFFSKCFTEPDSEEHIAHFIDMGLQTTPAVIAATIDAPHLDQQGAEAAAAAVRCPTLVLHGDCDEIAPLDRGINLARLTRGEIVVLPGSGHEPQCRIASTVNGLLDDFLGEHFAP